MKYTFDVQLELECPKSELPPILSKLAQALQRKNIEIDVVEAISSAVANSDGLWNVTIQPVMKYLLLPTHKINDLCNILSKNSDVGYDQGDFFDWCKSLRIIEEPQVEAKAEAAAA